MTEVNVVSGSARPLLGKRIMVTRARPQAAALAHKLQALGAEVLEFPTIEMQPPKDYAALDAAINDLQSYDWLIFTSVNGVEQFLTRARYLDKTVTKSKSMRFAAIGPETARRLKAAGIRNCLVPKRYQAEGILEMFSPEKNQWTTGDPLPKGAERNGIGCFEIDGKIYPQEVADSERQRKCRRQH